MKKILFVCTGNTCRSPMAAALFNKMAEERGLACRAESAGLAALEGAPVSENALAALAERGIRLAGHRARGVTPALLAGCDAVYTMSENHRAALMSAFAALKDRVHLLGGGISDPFGGSLADYRFCRDEIERALGPVLEECADERRQHG